MRNYFAYSVVYRDKEGSMHVYLSHCKAVSKAEAKGIAMDEFEEREPKGNILSLLIREITPFDDDKQEDKQLQHSFDNTYIKPEFTLK